MRRGPATRWFRLLLRCYPAEQRAAHGGEMEEVFRELLEREVARRGRWVGGTLACLEATLDTALHAVAARRRAAPDDLAHLAQAQPVHAFGARAGGGMTGWFDEIRHASRSLSRRPGFALLSVLLLGAGIAINTTQFGVVRAVLLRPLPYPEPDRLVAIWSQWIDFEETWVSQGEYREYRDLVSSFDGVALFERDTVTLGGDAPERVRAIATTPNLLAVLGASPALGRDLSEEDAAQSRHVALISHELWSTRLGRDARALGTVLEVDGRPFEIVGVLPAGLALPQDLGEARRADVWAPLAVPPGELEQYGGGHGYYALARLRDGVSLAQARAEVEALNQRHTDEGIYSKEWRFRTLLVPATDEVVARVRPILWTLLAAAAAMLAIAAANVAALSASQALLRSDEWALRSALGADRLRVVRQITIECAVLAALAFVVALPAARGGIALVRALSPPDVPRLEATRLELPELLFAAGLAAILTAILGFWPALAASLRERRRGLARRDAMARTTGLYRSALVALQVALSVVLVFGTGLMLRSLDRLLRIDPGFGKASGLTFRVDLLAAHYPTRDDVVGSARRLLATLESLPGVERAAAVRALPLASDMGDWGVGIEGYEMRSEQPPSAEWQAASPGYFEALGIPLLDGRTFEPRDDETGQPVIAVNQEFVRRYLGTGPVLGRRLVVYGTDPPVQSTLVGVVGDVRHVGLTADPKPTFYLPHAQFARSAGFPIRSLTVVLEVPAGDRAARELLPAARRSVAAFDPRMPVFDARTLDEVLAGTVSQPRLSTALLSFFALAALLLASLGIGGVVAHAVARRRRELGIRLAVGARPRDAIRHVFAGGAAVVGAGLLLGVAGGVLAGRALRGLLYGVAPLDAATLVLTLALLGLVGMVACWLPARRAARVDPTRVLRQE